jgi:hypothetical protein
VIRGGWTWQAGNENSVNAERAEINSDSFRAALYAAMLWQLVQTGRFAAQCALVSYLGSAFLIVYGR